jgi:hypothetical protein
VYVQSQMTRRVRHARRANHEALGQLERGTGGHIKKRERCPERVVSGVERRAEERQAQV